MNRLRVVVIVSFVFSFAILVSGCGDMGSDLPLSDSPVVSAVYPDSGSIGDTVWLSGSGFGSTRSASVVRFGGVDAQIYARWSDTLIVTVIPANAGTSPITVVVGTAVSNPVTFKVIGTAGTVWSFSADILPWLTRYGCAGCHGGNGGLYVDTQPHLLQGGNHGPAVTPGNADGSLIIQKLSANPPFGSRMPQGGPYLTDSAVQKLKEWINQGAPDN